MYTKANSLVVFTEKAISNIIIKTKINKKRKKLHPILDWISAFVWAIVVVFIINQILFQAFYIPTESMNPTLKVSDRIIVNKTSTALNKKPNFGDIITFKNPEYNQKGIIQDTINKLVFMFTLSTVNLDRDDDGSPSQHYLIKRVVGTPKTTVAFNKGQLYLKRPGDKSYTSEADFKSQTLNNYSTLSTVSTENYKQIDTQIKNKVYNNLQSFIPGNFSDYNHIFKTNYKYLSNLSPSMVNYYKEFLKSELGSYIPTAQYFVLGDNRNNSRDSRDFNLIDRDLIQGETSFIFWPLNRFGKTN